MTFQKQITSKSWKIGLRFGLVYILLLSCCLQGLGKIPFHGDESAWIYMSRNYEVFLQGNAQDPIWKESFWTLTQPPVVGYWIGMGRNLGGISAEQTNQPYDFFVTHEENIANGSVPNAHLLWWSRLPMAVLTSISFLLLFGMIEFAWGPITSLAFLILTLANQYLFYCLRLALGEASLLFFLCLAMFSASWAYHTWITQQPEKEKRIRSLFLPIGCMSLMIGLSTASKLNGGFAMLAAIFLTQYLGAKEINKKLRFWLMIHFPLIIGFISYLTFVAVNPFLYINPILNSLKLFMFRNLEIGIQQSAFPQYQISGILSQIQIDIQRILQTYIPFQFPGGWLLNLVLLLSGLIFLFCNRKQLPSQPTGWVLLIFGFAVSIPSLFTPLDYSRYFLFPVLFSQIGSAIGLGVLVKLGYQKTTSLIQSKLVR